MIFFCFFFIRNDDDNDSDFIDGPLHLMSIATNIAVKSRYALLHISINF